MKIEELSIEDIVCEIANNDPRYQSVTVERFNRVMELVGVLANKAKAEKVVGRLVNKIKNIGQVIDDAGFAVTFQTMGQYRTALIKMVKQALKESEV